MKVFFQQTIANIKAFPGGLKKVYYESKYVYSIAYNKDVKLLKRRDAELVRTNFKSIKKLSAFILIQAVPIVGYIPLICAFQFPKQILTHHFWTEKQLETFLQEDYLKSYESSYQIMSNQGVSSEKMIDDFIKNHGLYFPKDSLSLDNLSTNELDQLGASNVICSSDFALKWTHNVVLRRWLDKRAKELAFDDLKLLEEGTNDLTVEELAAAGIRRGVNPTLSPDTIKNHLDYWLRSDELKSVRTAVLSEVPTADESRQHSLVLLLHTVAFNAVRTYKTASEVKAVHDKQN